MYISHKHFCTLLRFISNFVSSNYFFNFSWGTLLVLKVKLLAQLFQYCKPTSLKSTGNLKNGQIEIIN